LKTLDTLYFNDVEELCNEILKEIGEPINDNGYGDVSVIAKCNVVRNIIESLICYGCHVESVHVEQEDYDNYFDEYILTVDDQCGVWCEPFKRDGEYFRDESDIAYIHSDCSSKVISHIESPVSFAFEIGECDDDDCCGEYDECDCKTLDGVDPSYLFDDSDLNPGEYLGSILHDDDPCDTKFLCLILDKDDCVSGFKFVDFDEESYRITSSTTRSSDFEYLVDMIGKLFE